MTTGIRCKAVLLLIAAFLLMLCLSACSFGEDPGKSEQGKDENDTSMYVVAIEDEPDTVDFQCTTIFYTVATNVFDRLVESEADENGNIVVKPSLAESWEESEDGLIYTFHLRDDVRFSNGSPLTSSDVLYTFTRLLTNPESCNQEYAERIKGAIQLEKGKTDKLEGFRIIDDHTFSITLAKPFGSFLAMLSVPAVSIMDEESTRDVSDRFGKDPECTIGTGPYIFTDWEENKGLMFKANKDCWSGAPNNEGLDLRFIEDPEDVISLFENSEIDVLDLEEVGNSAEYFIHGDIYQDRLYEVDRMGIEYIALNESKEPLNDVRVRRALQLGLDRPTLLEAVYSGRGRIENGIYPHGLYGFDPHLREIPYDQEKAKALLAEAGYADGFDLIISIKSSSTQLESTLMKLATQMWQEIGVNAKIETLEEMDFMRRRKTGDLMCYTALWTADYNDPENFIYTFFGDRDNTTYRSLCYPREKIMRRVRRAAAIVDEDKRIKEYRDLEKIIVQKDAAWVPLFSRKRLYVVSERVSGLVQTWNGSVKNNYRKISIKG